MSTQWPAYLYLISRTMKRHTRILALITAIYIVLALIWWSILLFQKNEAIFEANLKILELTSSPTVQTGSTGLAREQLINTYERQRWMVLGESLFILVSVMIGIWLIFRSYIREQHIIKHRRNFLLSITHELKTPLTAMRLAFETIQKRQLSPEQIAGLTSSSIQEADRLTETVNNLLLSARVDRKYVPRPEERTLEHVCESWASKCHHHWPNRDIRFTFSATDIAPVTADWAGLDIVFRNLIENAIKYSSAEKPVDISLGLVQNEIELVVSDLGSGIHPSERNRIFDMFYRIGNEDTRDGQGTGLGLYLVREIVRQNKGKIQLHNNLPTGSRFCIQIPL